MTLFKYIRPERVDVIRNLEIRFTQPDALNDPFELQPHIDSLVAEADVLENLPESPTDLRPMVKQAYELVPELQAIPLDYAMRAMEELMSTEDARQAAAEGLRIFLTSMRDGAAVVRQAIHRAFNENVGLLSLSEIPDNELMWAHYANSHTGLVLCFNDQHAFFNRRRTENDEFYFIRKVRYSDDPPVSLANIDGDALLITKGTKWSYEREWRMLVPLRDATRSMPIAGDTVYLFAFPPDALLGVILGVNATPDTEAEVKNLLDRPNLRHVRITRAILDLDSRSIKVPDEAANSW
jgi:hypothetical protein